MRRIILIVTVAWTACAPATVPERLSRATEPGFRHNTLTQRELSENRMAGSLLDALTRLRPNFLRGRDPERRPDVYFDDSRIPNGISELRTIRPESVHEVRYLNAMEATLRYGILQNSGAIVVILSRS
jgi:hypothetical protein